MADLKHDLSVLATVARLDASLTEFRGELSRLPEALNRAERALAAVETKEQNAIADFEAKQKERRTLETELQDNEAKIIKFKGDLMQVEGNREYKACLKEISNLEGEIDAKEERLLVLMDELDDRRAEHEADLKQLAQEKTEKKQTIDEINARIEDLKTEIARMDQKKPAYLREIDPSLKKKYDRLLGNLGVMPAARVEGEGCGGCGAKLPPQMVVEIRENDQLLFCQAFGRILIHYVD